MIKDVKLTSLSKTAGCAAKIGPKTLSGILSGLPEFYDENLLVGIDTSDDGAVYKINDECALISTLDFFTPVVDDPYLFGQIAATNALSDIYAMGGEPKVALNIVAFSNCLDPGILGEILKGGASKVKQAGAVLCGGHSIQDDEPKYGLAVNGFVHPDKILTNAGARANDVLILTKQIGVGLINTALKVDMASQKAMDTAAKCMTSLNKKAKDIIEKYNVNACTDVTGFGLLGHLKEMSIGSGFGIHVNTKEIEFIPEAMEIANMGIVPEGTYKNKEFALDRVEVNGQSELMLDLLCDPQTSGGLLVSVSKEDADNLYNELKNELDTKVSIVGTVTEDTDRIWLM